MKRGSFFLVLCTLSVILSLTFIQAGFNYSENSIKREYLGGENIQGKIKLSLKDEPSNAIIRSNFNGQMQLIDLLKRNNFQAEIDYRCSNRECGMEYDTKSEINSVSLSGTSDKKIFGFKITGESIDIDSLSFTLASDASPACSPPLTIDILNKNESFIQNARYTNNACEGSKSYGCFSSGLSSQSYQHAQLSSRNKYCEKIKLPVAPAYTIGAKIKNNTQGEGDLIMSLYSMNLDLLDDCILPKNSLETEEISCIVNYSIFQSDDYLVCVSSRSDLTDYKIRFEQSGEKCGTDDLGSSFDKDYEIFSKSMQFDSGDISINEEKFALLNFGESLREYFREYIEDRYASNCSKGCILPFGIKGNSQNVNIGNLSFKYRIGNTLVSGQPITYYLENKNPTISSNFIEIDISKAELNIPISSKEKYLELFIGSRKVFSSPLNISIKPSFYFDIEPKVVPIGLDVLFYSTTTKSISSSTWKFDDEDIIQVQNKSIVKNILTEGEHKVEVELKASDGTIARKVFTFISTGGNESARKMIERGEKRLANITLQINTYPNWIAEQIKSKVNLTNINESLLDFRKELDANISISDIISRIIQVKVPYSIKTSSKGVFPISVGYPKIDLDYIEEISNKSLGEKSKEELLLNILNWIEKNYQVGINSEEISVYSESGKESLFTKVKININTQLSNSEDYLIFNYPLSQVIFKENYGASEISSGTYLEISNSKEIEFILPGSIKVADLGIYVSPSINRFNLIEEIENAEKPVFPIKFFSFWMAILIFAIIIIYIILQEWYKNRYEGHLFKNKDDLYNIITFIYTSRTNKIDDKQTKGKLLENKWSGEQIVYAFNKIDGKRTGMYEIPIFKSSENKKVRQEIEKRSGQVADARFIKRPGL